MDEKITQSPKIQDGIQRLFFLYSFTEFMEIVEQDGQFVLRLKHFNPDFSGWEVQDEHVTFTLESVTHNQALFRG